MANSYQRKADLTKRRRYSGGSGTRIKIWLNSLLRRAALAA
jgi:hypothetical protein